MSACAHYAYHVVIQVILSACKFTTNYFGSLDTNKTPIESDRELENRPGFTNLPTEKPTKNVVSICLYIRSFDHLFSQHDNAIVRRMSNGLLVLQH